MDIDLDLPSFDPIAHFPNAVRASMVKDGQIVKHPAGVYFQTMPKDKLTKLAAIPYEPAEEMGFFKVDFLHLGLLDQMPQMDKAAIRELIKIEPNWSLLLEESVVERLFQLRKHFVLLLKLKPKSVEELADCIALLRPAKRHLIDKYLQSPQRTRTELYKMPLPPGCFKRGHAIAYALTIVIQLHLIELDQHK